MTDPKIETLRGLCIDRLIEALSDPETTTPGYLQAALRLLGDTETPLPEPGAGLKEIGGKIPFPTK